MNPQVTALVWIHYIASGLLGLPALAVSLYSGYWWVQSILDPLPPLTPPNSSQDGMVQVITGVGFAIGSVFRPLASLGIFFIKIAFVVSIVVLLFSAVLFLTGRGLSLGSTWARGLSGLALGGMALVGALGCLLISGPVPRLLASSLALGGGYGLYILATGFKVK
jgi:hypothetical protein